MRYLICLLAICFFMSCSSSRKATSNNVYSSNTPTQSASPFPMLNNYTFKLTEISTDETYGYTTENPVKVGGVGWGPENERRYLNALTGPNGEEITYHRLGSCCPFNTPNGIMGGGMLDRYEIKYKGLSKPIIIYINMYDQDHLKAPKGLKYKE